MYSPQKRLTTINERLIERFPWATLITVQSTGRLVMLDRPCDAGESLQSIDLTTYGVDALAGQVLYYNVQGATDPTPNKHEWIPLDPANVPAQPPPVDQGRVNPDQGPNRFDQPGSYYHAQVDGRYTEFMSSIGYHEIQGYNYRQYVPGDNYRQDEIVFFDGLIYRCDTDVLNAPQKFPYASFVELNTGNMYSDSQNVDVTADYTYALCHFDTSSAVLLNISFDNDHILQISITTSGEINVLSSNWDTLPWVKTLTLEDDLISKTYLLFTAANTKSGPADEDGVQIKVNGFALTGAMKVEPERPIYDYGTPIADYANVHNLNKGSGSFRGGELRSASRTFYIDDQGKPVPIAFAVDPPGMLVHKQYVDSEIAKTKTLISTFNPQNNINPVPPAPPIPAPPTYDEIPRYLGWVDTDLRVIPDPTKYNKGHYYVISANSRIETRDVAGKDNTMWTGNNTANAHKFVVAGDITAFLTPQMPTQRPGLVRVFLRAGGTHVDTDPHDWYSTDIDNTKPNNGITFDGANTIIDLKDDPREALAKNEYHTIFTYVPWPPYFRRAWLPPEGEGVLTNHTIISSGTHCTYPDGTVGGQNPAEFTNKDDVFGGMSNNNYGSGGWKLLESGVESISERVLTEINLPNHGFIEGQQVYLGPSINFKGTNAVAANTFVMDARYPDLTKRGILTTDDVVLQKDDGSPFTAHAVTVTYTAGQNVVVIDLTPPTKDYTSIRSKNDRWRLATGDQHAGLKMGFVDAQFRTSRDHFYLVMYGIVEYNSQYPLADTDGMPLAWQIGETYYLNVTKAATGTDPNPPSNLGWVQKATPRVTGSYAQVAFEVLVVQGTTPGMPNGYSKIKVVDWKPDLNALITGDSSKLVLKGQPVSDGVNNLNNAKIVYSSVWYDNANNHWELSGSAHLHTKKEGIISAKSGTGRDYDITIYGIIDIPNTDPPLPYAPGNWYLDDAGSTPTKGTGKSVNKAPTSTGSYVQETFEVLSTHKMMVVDYKVTFGAVIPEWNPTNNYRTPGMVVLRSGFQYKNINPTGNLNKDPAVATNKTFWKRITTRIFPEDDDPTTAGGGNWDVINGDLWVDVHSIPANALSINANETYFRYGNLWQPISSTRVIAKNDGWNVRGKVTELIVEEKHIDGTSQEKGAVSLGFIARDNNWHRIKIWDMPWGYHTAYRTGTNWSVDFYGGIPVTQSSTFKKGRSYMVQWGIAILNDSSNAQAIEGSVKIGGSTVAYDGGFVDNYNAANLGSTWYYSHSGADASRSITIVVGSVSHQIKWSKAWFYIIDQGPA